MALTLETVVKQLTDSGIIARGKLENFVPPKAHPASVDELVSELVKQKELTPFQAAQVKAGKVRALILGEYTIVDRIGAGGMGQVFKAVHRRMDRTVAIKMLPPAMLKDAAAVARFEREVRAAAKLEHPNIVAAYDAGQAGAAHFLVMQYVDGKDLSALVKKDGALPVAKAVNYILQAARGLEFAHSKGVIHRDIKPANLLLGSDGVVKILDMGLARIEQAGGEQAELTGTGAVMGTVDYMSPEQALNTKHADQRADIYSLGISLYYLLAGKAAYGGETVMEKLMAHQTHPIPNLQDVQTTVPKQLDDIFKLMVAKKADERYQSMSEVIEALDELGLGTATKKREVASTLALTPEQKKKLTEEAKRKKRTAAGTAAAAQSRNLVIKVVGGAFGTIIAPILVFYLIRYLDKREEPAKPPIAASESSPPSPLAGEGVGASKIGDSSIAQPPRESPEAKTLTPYEILTSPDYEWTEPENLGPTVNTRGADIEPTLSADGLTLIFKSYGRGGKLCQATRSSVDQPFDAALPLPEIFVNARRPSLSGDGLTLVYEETGELWQASRRSPRDPFDQPAPITELNSPTREESPFLSSDGLTIVFGAQRPGKIAGNTWISRRASRDAKFDPPRPFVFPWPSGMGVFSGLAVSSDERVWILGVNSQDLWMATRPASNAPFAATVRLTAPINTAEHDEKTPTLSADGTVLIFSSGRPGGLGDSDLWQTRRVRKKGVTAAVATTSSSPPAVVAALPVADGPPGKVWSVGPRRLSAAYFLHDGNLLARQFNSWGVVDPRTGARQTSVTFNPPNPKIGRTPTAVALSPDQRWFVLAMWPSGGGKIPTQICLADAISGQQLRTLLDEEGRDTFSNPVGALAVSPDSRRIVVNFEDVAPKSLAVFDVDSGKLIKRLAYSDTGDSKFGSSLAFAPDGKLSATDNSRLWLIDIDQETRQFINLPQLYRRALVFSADGRRALAPGGKTVNKVDVAYLAMVEPAEMKLREAAPDPPEMVFQRADISADGRWGITASKENLIQLWDLDILTRVAEIGRESEPVSVLRFSPDGRYALCGTDKEPRDGTLTLYRLPRDVWPAEKPAVSPAPP